MATVNGIPVNFGFTGTNGITISGNLSGKLVLQSADHGANAELEVARGGTGDHAAHGWYDDHDEATIECVIRGTDIANAIAVTILDNVRPGTFVNITSCPNRPGMVKATWEVQSGARITGRNTNFAQLSIPIHYRSTITAAAS